MNLLILSTSTNNVHTFIGSLKSLGEHQVVEFFYDRKYYEQLNEVVRQNPSMLEQVQQGRYHMQRDRAAMDSEMLMEAKISKPDAIIYISAWTGAFVPLNETLGELNSIAPVIHMLCDGQDPPWFEQLYEFDRRNQFTLTVNIDGGHDWPGGKKWSMENWSLDTQLKGKCMTLLTPVDPSAYRPTGLTFRERPYPIGYSGSPSSAVRAAVIGRLNRVAGFNYRARDVNPASYPEHIAFLQHTQVSLNIPFTGSGTKRHVKGRVLESGFAGCCLLEWQSAVMREWFIPRFEYVEYTSVEEAAEFGEWYSHHPALAEDIGMALYRRCVTEHAPKVFWDKVLSEVR